MPRLSASDASILLFSNLKPRLDNGCTGEFGSCVNSERKESRHETTNCNDAAAFMVVLQSMGRPHHVPSLAVSGSDTWREHAQQHYETKPSITIGATKEYLDVPSKRIERTDCRLSVGGNDLGSSLGGTARITGACGFDLGRSSPSYLYQHSEKNKGRCRLRFSERAQ
jgi:hypothetical protein